MKRERRAAIHNDLVPAGEVRRVLDEQRDSG